MAAGQEETIGTLQATSGIVASALSTTAYLIRRRTRVRKAWIFLSVGTAPPLFDCGTSLLSCCGRGNTSAMRPARGPGAESRIGQTQNGSRQPGGPDSRFHIPVGVVSGEERQQILRFLASCYGESFCPLVGTRSPQVRFSIFGGNLIPVGRLRAVWTAPCLAAGVSWTGLGELGNSQIRLTAGRVSEQLSSVGSVRGLLNETLKILTT